MYSLNDVQIGELRAEVDRQHLTYGHLADDLVDHLACEIEASMWSGMSYEMAKQSVLTEVGNQGIHNVQKETLYLIDKNYRYMKNSVKWIGMISMILITLGTLFKILHFPGANMMFLVGFFLLGLIYFPVSLYVLKKESQDIKEPWLFGSAAAGGIMIMAGIIFKILHWPFALPIMSFGYILLNGMFIPMMLYYLLKSTTDRALRNVYSIGAAAMFMSIIGFIFKINHFPGAFIFLVLGSFGLTGIFLPLYAYHKYKASTAVKIEFVLLSTGIMYFIMFSLLLAIR